MPAQQYLDLILFEPLFPLFDFKDPLALYVLVHNNDAAAAPYNAAKF
jgi:hypothetical protein